MEKRAEKGERKMTKKIPLKISENKYNPKIIEIT